MTPGSKEKPLRLSTAWQLSDLWGLRTGRKCHSSLGVYPRFQEGMKSLEYRIFAFPFPVLSTFPLISLSFPPRRPPAPHAVLCYVLLYMHVHLSTLCAE